MYGANAAMNMSTIPATGFAIEDRSRPIGAFIWLIATRKITTTTSLETISATTKPAHLENQPRAASHDWPDSAIGASTTATSSSDLRISKLNQTIAAPVIARQPRK